MDNEISAGVKIILERCKTNPDEMIDDYGKWGQLRDAVYAYKEEGQRRAWVRGLREEEIDLLYEAFSTHARQIFDDYVMKQVLDGSEEQTLKYQASGRYGNGWLDPQLLQNVHPNNVISGGYLNVTVQSSGTSIVDKLKNAIGIK
jgi:hypothetical protein